ncbi:MAG: hypothetical protein AAF827_10385 [Cyanobacteria bacterium P01_D01_bin.6]
MVRAAHSAVDPPTLKTTHLQIGQLFRTNLSESEQAKRIFEIANHCNLGQELLNNAQVRSQLAELDLWSLDKFMCPSDLLLRQ